jgi:peptide/nickel transport system substrate-binding protein
MQKPIGAGPYKLVSQQAGIQLDFEAFEDYYRPIHVKQLTMLAVPEAATRVAMLERGEADIMYFVPGELIGRIKSNPKLMLAPVVSANWWLEFPGFQDPKSPFHDKRVREAISLAIDRDAMNQAECDGLGQVDGNWINDDVEFGMEWPKCGGFQGKDYFCVKELDDKFATYLASHDQTERKNLAYEIQRAMLENYYFVPVFRHAFVNAIGPRIAANKWQDVFPTYITSGYAYPWEDIELKETAAAEK